MQVVLDVLLTIFWAFIGFSVLVFFHELGHMIVGLKAGIGVEQFSIGMGPALLKFKTNIGSKTKYNQNSEKIDEDVPNENNEEKTESTYDESSSTENETYKETNETGKKNEKDGVLFKISAIPFGGYCKFKGQEDFGSNQRASEPDDFYSRPAWARLLTVLAGPVANVILGILIFTIFFMVPTQELTMREIVVNNKYADEVPFKTGDKIISINGKEIKYSEQILKTTMNNFEEEIIVTVNRNGEIIKLKYTPSYSKMEQGIQVISIGNSPNPYIRYVAEDSPADKSEIKEGDKIVKVNGKEVSLWTDISEIINDSDKEQVSITILRDNQEKEITLTPENQDGKRIIGVGLSNIVDPTYESVSRNVGVAFVKGLEETFNSLRNTIKGLGMLFSGRADVAKSVSGPIAIFGIVGTIGASQNFSQYIYLIAMISVLLGFFNLLPIPAVDGGHVILSIVEMIKGKPLRMKTIQVIQTVGVVIILTLFVVVAVKDIINLPDLLKTFGG